MFKEFLRSLSVILLIIIIVIDDFPFYNKMKDKNTQLFLAVLIILFIMYDTTFGFIMGLVLMVIYFEIYKKIIVTNNQPHNSITNNYSNYEAIPENYSNVDKVYLDYITQEHLDAVQNNVFDKNNYNTEIKGITQGYNNEKVYGIQGLDIEKVNYNGFDTNEKTYFEL